MDVKHRAPLILVGQDPLERGNASRLMTNLHRLAITVNEFDYSLALFDQTSYDGTSALHNIQNLRNPGTEKQRQARQDQKLLLYKASAWNRIAVTDGAIKLYYFAKAMKACIKLFKLCPTIHLEVELSDLEALCDEFEQNFPDWKNCRNAVTHEGDIFGDEMSKHVTKDQYSSPSVTAPPGNLITELRGSRFTTTWQGKIVGYDISIETLNKLRDITNRFYFLFDPSSGLDRAFTTPEHPGVSRYVQQEWRREAMRVRREAAEASKRPPKD